MKFFRIFFVLGILSLFLTAKHSFAADQRMKVEAKPIAYPLCKYVKVVPGKPFHLNGTGRVRANGRGHVYYNVKRGRVHIQGKGVVAVKVTDNDTVNVSGWGEKIQMGSWVMYMGKGKITVYGDDFKIVGFGRFNTWGRGTGSVTFRGYWRVGYCRLRILKPEAIPDVIPQNLKMQFQNEAGE